MNSLAYISLSTLWSSVYYCCRFVALAAATMLRRCFSATATVGRRPLQFLNALYCKGIGLAEESIFGFSVQTFTTPSLVRLLADATADSASALLPNPDQGTTVL